VAEAEADWLTLSVDTATEKRSVAVTRGPSVLALSVKDIHADDAASVLEEIDRALKGACVEARRIDLFAVVTGPGSFTGLRSGLATMKALASTLKKPLVGVPTLHALGHAARPASRLVCMLPAGRGEVFAQLLRVSPEGKVTELEEPRHLPPARLLERVSRLGGGTKWVGAGAYKFLELIEEGAKASGFSWEQTEDATAEPSENVWMLAPPLETLALEVALLARSGYSQGGALDTAEGAAALSAIYVRPSDAEIKGQCHAQS
jgi:tRNA threonylcarbamoyladenosine biosynthesis protein TsaB